MKREEIVRHSLNVVPSKAKRDVEIHLHSLFSIPPSSVDLHVNVMFLLQSLQISLDTKGKQAIQHHLIALYIFIHYSPPSTILAIYLTYQDHELQLVPSPFLSQL